MYTFPKALGNGFNLPMVLGSNSPVCQRNWSETVFTSCFEPLVPALRCTVLSCTLPHVAFLPLPISFAHFVFK